MNNKFTGTRLLIENRAMLKNFPLGFHDGFVNSLKKAISVIP